STMTIRPRFHVLAVVAALATALGLVASRQPVAAAPQATANAQLMPVDPAMAMGRYANGLRYYVRSNPKPEKRAELRLVVKAGSILEDDAHEGPTHFARTTAFTRTQ